MEQKYFPIYQAGQLLTSENLNRSFSYLDEQDRLSRNALFGYGILKGLSYSIDDKGYLTINPGKAITSDGYLIDFTEIVEYKWLVTYNEELINFPSSRLLTGAYLFYTDEEQKALELTPASFPINLSDYALGIIVDLAGEEPGGCNQKSCDVNHSKINIVYRPALLLKSGFLVVHRKTVPINNIPSIQPVIRPVRILPMNLFYSPLKGVKTKRLMNIIESSDLNVLQKKVMILFKENRDVITGALDSFNMQKDLLCELILEIGKNNFSSSINYLRSMKTKLEIIEGMTEIPSYYLLFLEDLKNAINEFVAFYNHYINSYLFYTSNIQKARLVVLGTGKTPPVQNDEYRNVFRPSCPNLQQTNDRNTLSRLFIRIQKLIDFFLETKVLPSNNQAITIKLVPGRDSSAKPEERSIPFYYDYNEIKKWWQALCPVPDQNQYNYNDFLDTDYNDNLEQFSFFRLEGHHGVSIDAVYTRITELIEKYDLPIKVIKMGLKKIKYVRQQYKVSIAELFNTNKIKELPKKIERNITLDEYKEIQKQLAKLDTTINFNTNYDINNHTLNISPSNLVQARDILATISPSKFEEFYYALSDKNKILAESYMETPIAAFNVLRTIVYDMCIQNYKMAEYRGGVFRNSTLVLLYNNISKNTIMEINIPGFIEPDIVATPTATVTTLAGSGTAGAANGTGTAAQFRTPKGITIDHAGNLYVADTGNMSIRKVSSLGIVERLIGFVSIAGTSTKDPELVGITIDNAGNLYVADTSKHFIRKFTQKNGKYEDSTFAGKEGTAGAANGKGTAAQFYNPTGITIDTAGNLYVADSGNHCIRKITSAGEVTTLAGNGKPGYTDKPGNAAQFHTPMGIAIDVAGNLYVADSGNHCIRKITKNGEVTTIAGNGTAGFVDGKGTTAQFNSPRGIAIDSAGNLYVTDFGDHRIRKITPAGVVTTLAGNGIKGYTDKVGTTAQFNAPFGITIDAAGNLYVADSGNNCIRKIEMK